RAAAFLSGGDSVKAALSARRAYQINPSNADAVRMLAKIAHRDGDPIAIEWWRKLITRNPNDPRDVLAYARSSLQSQQVKSAEMALHGLAADDKKSAEH